jgi:hypothetical protein
VDSYDKLGQDLNNELNWLSDVEQLLRDDHPISDDLDKVKNHLQAQKVGWIYDDNCLCVLVVCPALPKSNTTWWYFLFSSFY